MWNDHDLTALHKSEAGKTMEVPLGGTGAKR